MRLVFLFLIIPFLTFAQPPTDRYQANIFSTVLETSNILFSDDVPQPNPGGGFYEWTTGLPLNVDEYDTSPVDLYMDIFQPQGDTLSQRPLIIIAFGGGFLDGSKDHWSIRLLAQELAMRGFVTACIDYRLGMNVFDSDLANRAVYRGLQDIRSAVRFFRADAAGANTYKIDPQQIFLGGHSSGAFMALHNAYLEKEIERPISTYQWTQDGNVVPDQLCLDCVGENQSFDGHANGIFSLAGALGFTSFIETANDPKVVMFHSTDDGTVPYDSGGPFSSIIWLVIGSDLPDVYGSLPISQQATAVGLPYEFFSYTNRGHGVHEDGSSDLYDDIIPGISDWFYLEELKPSSDSLIGASIVCSAAAMQVYELEQGGAGYYDWTVSGGTFNGMSNYSSQVIVDWDPTASVHELTVVPYSALDAKGDSIILSIDLYNSADNTYQSVNSNWSDISNWSLGLLPNHCDDVIIPAVASPFNLSLDQDSNINSMIIGQNANLDIPSTSTLTILQKDPAASAHALEIEGQLNNSGILKVKNINAGLELKVKPGGSIHNPGLGEIGG